jgi:hypothetical protein
MVSNNKWQLQKTISDQLTSKVFFTKELCVKNKYWSRYIICRFHYLLFYTHLIQMSIKMPPNFHETWKRKYHTYGPTYRHFQDFYWMTFERRKIFCETDIVRKIRGETPWNIMANTLWFARLCPLLYQQCFEKFYLIFVNLAFSLRFEVVTNTAYRRSRGMSHSKVNSSETTPTLLNNMVVSRRGKFIFLPLTSYRTCFVRVLT